MKRLVLAGLLLGAGCAIYRPAGEGAEGLMPEDVAPEPAALRSLREAWLGHYHAAHPTRATVRGVRAHDGRWPDLSPSALGARLEVLRRYRSRLDRIDRAPLPEEDRRAADAMDAELRAELAQLEKGRAWERDPDFYRAVLAEGLRGILEAPFESLERRVAPLTARLEQVPAFLAQARENLVAAPRAATEAALASFGSLRALVESGLPDPKQAEAGPRFAEAQSTAAAALRAFETWMRTELLPRSTGAALPGERTR